ncbi:MAG: hypothetical protein AUI14_26370 [Actinobacteria bacterium 13_2_20CM_2_71_6]|nr:MAG: hypothetical protein AUI14_26370 [Actinobacteria bacterium 13_2_20CM_2_71_6]
MSRRLARLLAVAVFPMLVLAGCGGTGKPTGAGTTAGEPSSMPSMSMSAPAATGSATGDGAVSIQGFAFAPATITVKVGTTVIWQNADGEPHTVTARDKSFASATLNTGGTYRFTFTRPGRYEYLCTIHPFMTATVVVTP